MQQCVCQDGYTLSGSTCCPEGEIEDTVGTCKKKCVDKTYYECDGKKCFSNSEPTTSVTKWTCTVAGGTKYTLYPGSGNCPNLCHCDVKSCTTSKLNATCKCPAHGCPEFYFDKGCSATKKYKCGGKTYDKCSTTKKTACVEE